MSSFGRETIRNRVLDDFHLGIQSKEKSESVCHFDRMK